MTTIHDYKDYNDYHDYNDYNDFNDYNDYNDYSDYNNCNDYRDSDLDLDWERFSDLVTLWHSRLLLINCETRIIALRISDLQSDSDLHSIRNSCDVFKMSNLNWKWKDNLFVLNEALSSEMRFWLLRRFVTDDLHEPR